MDWQQVYDDGTIRLRVSKNPPAWDLWARPAATCIPVDNEGKLIVLHEKKANGRWVWGFAGGMIEEGEDAQTATARECEEELGFKPARLQQFIEVKTGFPDTSVTYFLGFDLQPGQKVHWVEEEIDEIKHLPIEEVLRMAEDGEFTEPRLVVALLKLKKMIANQEIRLSQEF